MSTLGNRIVFIIYISIIITYLPFLTHMLGLFFFFKYTYFFLKTPKLTVTWCTNLSMSYTFLSDTLKSTRWDSLQQFPFFDIHIHVLYYTKYPGNTYRHGGNFLMYCQRPSVKDQELNPFGFLSYLATFSPVVSLFVTLFIY